MSFDFEQIRLRVVKLNEDVAFADELIAKISGYETRLFALLEQKKFPDFQTEELQKAVEEQEKVMKKNIEHTVGVLGKVREKILRSLGKM